MKLAILLLFLFVSEIAVGQTTTIIFLDKSESVAFTNNVGQVRSVMNQFVANYRKEGDSMFAFYIHENTAGAGAAITTTAKKFNCPGCSTIELNQRKNTYANSLRQESADFGRTCYRILMDEPLTSSSRGTDIFGILVILSRIPKVASDTRVFLFSDMVHDTQGKKVYPSSLQSAQLEAKKDVEYVKSKYDFDPSKLVGISLSYILPINPAESKHNQHLDTYWKTFFKEFGISVTEVF